MKKFFQFSLLILLGMVMMSCKKRETIELKNLQFKDNDNFSTLSQVNYPSLNYEVGSIDNDMIAEINHFSYKLIKKIFTVQDNQLFAPLSLYMALSMLVEGTSSTTSAELENLLGQKREKLTKQLKLIYENNYYSNQNGRVYLANSLWLKKGLKINSEYLNFIKDNFYAQSYEIDFTKRKEKDKIIKWINYYTENILKLDRNNYQIEDNLALLLLNTIYFDNKWLIAYDKEKTVEDTFYLDKNNTKMVEYMNHQISTLYKKTSEYVVVMDYFENNNTITYIMPTIPFDKLCSKDFTSFTNDLVMGEVNLSVPKFDYSKEYNLNEALKSLGVRKIFEKDSLNKIGENLSVNYIKQNVGIKLSESGAKAAAVTSIGIMKSSLVVDPITIKLDRPFYI
ncbi:MAG: serpin family protein [Christensenellales bacterium]